MAGDTLLCTDKGFLFAEEAAIGNVNDVSSKDQTSRCDGIIFSGWKQTRKIIVENGFELVCTDDHLIETINGMIPADQLKIGDVVVLSRGINNIPEGVSTDYSVGFILGSFQGDGSFGSSDIVKFTIGKERKQEFGEAIKYHFKHGFGLDVVTTGKHYTNENTKILQVRRWGFHRFLKSLDLKSGHIPLFVRTGSKKLIAGYFAGLLASDGCSVDGRIQFTSKWECLVRELQIILLSLGIVCRRKSFIAGESSYKPGQTYWTLYVNAGESTDVLYKLVGNVPGRIIESKRQSNKESIGTVQFFEIEKIEGAIKNYPDKRISEPVYDVINSETHTFLASGFSVHNCLKDRYRKYRSQYDFSFCDANSLHGCW